MFTCHLSHPIFHQITARRHIYTSNEMQSFSSSTLHTSADRTISLLEDIQTLKIPSEWSKSHVHTIDVDIYRHLKKTLFDKGFGLMTHVAWCRKVRSVCLINKINQRICVSLCIENLCLILRLFGDSSILIVICLQICTTQTSGLWICLNE